MCVQTHTVVTLQTWTNRPDRDRRQTDDIHTSTIIPLIRVHLNCPGLLTSVSARWSSTEDESALSASHCPPVRRGVLTTSPVSAAQPRGAPTQNPAEPSFSTTATPEVHQPGMVDRTTRRRLLWNRDPSRGDAAPQHRTNLTDRPRSRPAITMVQQLSASMRPSASPTELFRPLPGAP